jgi:hypothetical protein
MSLLKNDSPNFCTEGLSVCEINVVLATVQELLSVNQARAEGWPDTVERTEINDISSAPPRWKALR